MDRLNASEFKSTGSRKPHVSKEETSGFKDYLIILHVSKKEDMREDFKRWLIEGAQVTGHKREEGFSQVTVRGVGTGEQKVGQVFYTTTKVAERGRGSSNLGSDTVERKGIKTALREDSATRKWTDAQVGPHFQSRVVEVEEERRTLPHIILPLSSFGEVDTGGDVGRPRFFRTKKMAVDCVFKEEEVSCLGIPIRTRTFAVTGKGEQNLFLDTLNMRGVKPEVEFKEKEVASALRRPLAEFASHANMWNNHFIRDAKHRFEAGGEEFRVRFKTFVSLVTMTFSKEHTSVSIAD